MSWRIVYHEQRPENVKVGDMWPAPWLLYDREPSTFFFSDDFIARIKSGECVRSPLIVRLPGNADFCVDGPPFQDGRRQPGGWTVTGEPHAITVYPSINIRGVYHGWIREGVITDDCEGRRYNDEGGLL